MEAWVSISGVVGILGFLLSLALAYLRWRDNRVNVSVSAPRLSYSYPGVKRYGVSFPCAVAILSLTISNKSLRNFPLLGASFVPNTVSSDHCEFAGAIRAGLPFRLSDIEDSGKMLTETHTTLPLNLLPLCSQRISLPFCIPLESELPNLLASWRNQVEGASNRTPRDQKADPHSPDRNEVTFPLCLTLETPGRPVVVAVQAVYERV